MTERERFLADFRAAYAARRRVHPEFTDRAIALCGNRYDALKLMLDCMALMREVDAERAHA